VCCINNSYFYQILLVVGNKLIGAVIAMLLMLLSDFQMLNRFSCFYGNLDINFITLPNDQLDVQFFLNIFITIRYVYMF